jgi:hypothetical protein
VYRWEAIESSERWIGNKEWRKLGIPRGGEVDETKVPRHEDIPRGMVIEVRKEGGYQGM